jgi:predicted ATPase
VQVRAIAAVAAHRMLARGGTAVRVRRITDQDVMIPIVAGAVGAVAQDVVGRCDGGEA